MSGAAAITAAARAQVYDLLAIVFRRPLDARRLQRLRTPKMLAAMSAAAIDPGRDFASSDGAALLDRLAIDYTQLFHGPVERISPYECIQLGESEDLMGAAAEEVRRFLAAHLGRWAERFARKVWDRAPTPFYAAMAELLSGHIADEHGAQAA